MSVRNLDKLFKPGAVALIGATLGHGSLGAVLSRNLRRGALEGPLMLVSPDHRPIGGVPVHHDIASLPEVPDLAVIATPPETVPGLIAELGARGTRAAVVITAGFGGQGASGRALQQAMLDAARPHLLRLAGPNCVGIMVPAVGLDASFSHILPLAGDLAFVSQSGGMIAAVLDWAAAREIGFSHVVSVGDMVDVDFGDMLDYLAADAGTRAILLCIEAITHARKFMSAARAAARNKPVLMVKVGRFVEEAHSAASRTGALAADQVLGVSRFAADPDNRQAEYAVEGRSDWKESGLGYLLMARLIDVARHRRVGELVGEVLRETPPCCKFVVLSVSRSERCARPRSGAGDQAASGGVISVSRPL